MPIGKIEGSEVSDCPRRNSWFGSCKFEPRYDIGPSQMKEAAEGSAAAVVAMAEKYRAKIYVRDVCVKCGRTIERTLAAERVSARGEADAAARLK